nr:probable E3 ubiquitin-protein ligase RNF144A-B [Ipomoea batatas]GME14500.1 probable E3 ubiquitin-protein ligase RNF144A-B [Ipomoea batatas]
MRNSTPERPNDELQFLGSNTKVSGLKSECSTSRRMGKDKVSEDGTKKPDGSTFMCKICSDEKQRIEVFRIMGCNHSYCSDCASKYVAAKLQDSTFRICCPVSGCGGVIEPENCRLILPKTVFDRWGDALCEAMILSLDKFYCPYKDCSALLIDENLEIVESECPECRRLFCAKCKVPWHSEISCSEFQKFHENERAVEVINIEEEETFMCEICYDEKEKIEIFKIMGCNHSYCSECVSKYIGSKVEDNISRICCPVTGCEGVLEPENCLSILPRPVFDRWVDALCEAMILASEKFYCPFKDCSALLIDEKVEVAECECPECRRLFCAKCKVPWHSEISCSEFQKLNKNERQREDIQLMNFAAGRQWKRCPNCGIYVERVSGCGFMVCRCRCNFCYTCGAATPKDHFCRNCGT